MRISRNAPCPCGSGKKVKKCCGVDGFNKNIQAINHKDHFIEDKLPNENPPEFSESFFKNVDKDNFCPYKLMYSCLLHPEIDSLASSLSNQVINRGKEEARLIKKCQTSSELIEIMKNRVDPLNHELMRSRIIEKKEDSLPQLLEALTENVRNDFIELSIRTLFLIKVDISEKLMTIISEHNKSAYQIAMLCILLGFYENPKNIRFLWNYFLYFRSKMPNQNYWKGPFYGLWEIWARNKFDKKKKDL